MKRGVRFALIASLVLACGVAVQQSASKDGGFLSLDELLLFFPSKHPDGYWEPENLDYEDVWLQLEDGTSIHAWYCPHPQPIATVLFLHGNAGNLSHRAPVLRRLQNEVGVSTMIVDYPGYGRSEGKPSVANALEAARRARTRLAELAGVAEAEVVLLGRSLGGAFAVALAAEAPARALVLESTFSSMQAVADLHYPALSWMVPEGKLDSAASMAQVQAPLLQSHGDADEVIPIELGRALFEAAPDPKQFLTHLRARHNDPMPPSYDQELRQFLAALPQ